MVQPMYWIALAVVATVCFGPVHSLRIRNHILPKDTRTTQRQSSYSYKTYYYEQYLDHFGFASNKTFKQRYLVADQYWNFNGGPIFFYTGNEGDITLFCENTGFIWDTAPEFRALIVFAEHRFYGETLPFGPDTYKDPKNLNYLTSEQALADFAVLVRYLKSTIKGAENSPVIAIGGSYGGMLAAWFRIKYPNVVNGSLAASAPIWSLTGLTKESSFYDVTANTWYSTSKNCVANVNRSYDVLNQLGNEVGGLDFISKTFNLCTPLKSKYDLQDFVSFLIEMYTNYAMVDYPYPANFLAELPGWPIKVACGFLSEPMSGKPLLSALSKVTNLYYNYTGNTQCIPWKNNASTPALGINGWDYQACTEMTMPMSSTNTGMFPNMEWNEAAYSDGCYKSFKVRPRTHWTGMQYWAKDLAASSNIIFSNGLYDPWSSGGVMQSVSDSIIAIQIPYGAHHLDLRAKNKLDTLYVQEARQQEKNIIRNWLGLSNVN